VSRDLVRNAADPQQVRHAARKQREQEERFQASLRRVLAAPEGRVVLWSLLERAGIFRSIWDPSAKIHYNAGRQDFGHEILALCLEADEELYQLMERDARAFAKRTDRETAAIQQTADERRQSGG
jgi:hypothetical protein